MFVREFRIDLPSDRIKVFFVCVSLCISLLSFVLQCCAWSQLLHMTTGIMTLSSSSSTSAGSFSSPLDPSSSTDTSSSATLSSFLLMPYLVVVAVMVEQFWW